MKGCGDPGGVFGTTVEVAIWEELFPWAVFRASCTVIVSSFFFVDQLMKLFESGTEEPDGNGVIVEIDEYTLPPVQAVSREHLFVAQFVELHHYGIGIRGSVWQPVGRFYGLVDDAFVLGDIPMAVMFCDVSRPSGIQWTAEFLYNREVRKIERHEHPIQLCVEWLQEAAASKA
jgi:hypothetical protein